MASDAWWDSFCGGIARARWIAIPIVAFGLLFPTSAQALLEPIVENNIPQVSQAVARGGATPPIPGVSCNPVCQEFYLAEGTATQPTSAQMHAELRALRWEARVLPPLRVLGTIGLAAGIFQLGWKMGTGINSKFLKIGLPDTPDPDSYFVGFSTQWLAAGEPVTHAGVAPTDAFYLRGATSSGSSLTGYLRGNPAFQGACQVDYDPGPMPDWTDVTTGQASCRQGSGLPYGYREVHAYYKKENDFPALGPVEDYVAQPYDRTTSSWANQPTTATQLDDRVRTSLATLPIAEAWYAHQLDPENYPDPTTTENEDHRCDLSSPSYKNPGGNISPEPYTARAEGQFQAPIRPPGALSAPDPYLRYGKTVWGGEFIDNWLHWGWRHIRAKHGWSPADEAATRATLLAPTSYVAQSNSSMRYVGPEETRNGAACQRVVIVEFGVQSGDPPDTPKGIITSYEEFVRSAN